LNDYFLSIYKDKTELLKSVLLIKAKLGHFEDVNSFLRNLKTATQSESRLFKFLIGHSAFQKEKVEIIFQKIYPRLKKLNSLITLSRSGTVLEILKLWHQKNKNIRVVVCESRPKFEGRLMAESLAESGIKTKLITDAMMGIYIPKVDAALIGADVILKNGNVVNKVGSKSLAVLCREYRKPLYVVSTKSKLSTTNEFKLKNEDPKEIFSRKVQNLAVSNIYFEEIDKSLINKIFTD
jgi:translation initiation factor eIF-2B subunit delta